ncbi:MAG: flavin reductase family protein [Epsilonproteobacteria bacterium]|nr:flavin reductase family protein [Campylobacterota bacterium]
MVIDFSKIDKSQRYYYISNSVVPRPIAWISTFNSDGSINLAPFSYFTPLSSQPPTLLVSIGHKKDGSPKDTLKNIRENKKATISIATFSQIEEIQKSALSLEYLESEVKKFDIKTTSILDQFPPIPTNSFASFFCKYYKEVKLDNSSTIPVIFEIEYQYINDQYIKDNKIDPSSVVARVGSLYANLINITEANI